MVGLIQSCLMVGVSIKINAETFDQLGDGLNF